MKIVMLAGKGDSSLYMYNGLKDQFDITKVVIEDEQSRTKMIKRRIHNIGIIKVLGQIVFIVFRKLLFKTSKKKLLRLKDELNLSDEEIDSSIITRVESVNSDETEQLLKSINPDIVVVNGTRIISKRILDSVNAIFLNTHMGITPKYRGSHGGYWALANNDKEHCGTTVHIIDPGIDTGGILYQRNIETTKSDNFCTYPLHQIRIGIDMMKEAIHDVEFNRIAIKNNDLESNLWYHPDILTYINNWIFKGIK